MQSAPQPRDIDPDGNRTSVTQGEVASGSGHGGAAGTAAGSGTHKVAAVKLSRAQRFHIWLRSWASGPYAMPAMATLSFADACVSPILPEVIMVPMVMGDPKRRHMVTFWASFASVAGGILGYILGMTLWQSGLDQLFYDWVPGFTEKEFARFADGYGSNAFLWVFLAGFTPLPYKLATVTAGVCYAQVDFGTFVLASALSRPLRFWVEVELLHRLGLPMMKWLSRRAGVTFFGILGIALLAWWLWPSG